MTLPLTPEQLEGLRTLLAKGARESDSGWYIDGYTDDGLSVISDGLHCGIYRIAAEKPQAELIVALVNAAPSLLARIRELEIELGINAEHNAKIAEQRGASISVLEASARATPRSALNRSTDNG
jgi:hypothetical protein